jgi:hypothetical protein
VKSRRHRRTTRRGRWQYEISYDDLDLLVRSRDVTKRNTSVEEDSTNGICRPDPGCRSHPVGGFTLLARSLPCPSSVGHLPLIGMGIATFAMVWCFIKMWQYRHGWSPLNNLLANFRTLLRRRDARSDALVDRLTLPPAEFERKLADGA